MRALIYKPIRDKNLEEVFIRVLSFRYKLNLEILKNMSIYFSDNEIRPDSKYDLFYVFNMFSGGNFKFPTVEQLYELETESQIYIDMKEDDRINQNFNESVISYASKYKMTPLKLVGIYNDVDSIMKGEMGRNK